ncbi:hypothetical protein J9B32_31040, partial [Klebsiella pneumoniae]
MNIIQVLLTVVTVIGFTKTCGRLDNLLDMLYNVISSVESIMNIIQVLLTVVTVIGFTKTCGRL